MTAEKPVDNFLESKIRDCVKEIIDNTTRSAAGSGLSGDRFCASFLYNTLCHKIAFDILFRETMRMNSRDRKRFEDMSWRIQSSADIQGALFDMHAKCIELDPEHAGGDQR